MAELIDKGALMKDIISRFGCRPYIEVGNKCEYVHTILAEQPTITEADIRAKAIDDFVEHINLPLTTEEDITKILEQLKEE